MSARELVITVFGTPAPQGSKRHVGRGIMVESSAKVKPWREAVKHAAIDACNGYWSAILSQQTALMTTAVLVDVTFTLQRPKGHYRTGKNSTLLRDAESSAAQADVTALEKRAAYLRQDPDLPPVQAKDSYVAASGDQS